MQKTVHVELSLASSNIAILPLVSPMYVLGLYITQNGVIF